MQHVAVAAIVALPKARQPAVEIRDDAGGDAQLAIIAQAEWVADCNRPLAASYGRPVADGGGLQSLAICTQNREVAASVGGHYRCLGSRAVVEDHLDADRVLNHVLVCQNQTIGRNDGAGAVHDDDLLNESDAAAFAVARKMRHLLALRPDSDHTRRHTTDDILEGALNTLQRLNRIARIRRGRSEDARRRILRVGRLAIARCGVALGVDSDCASGRTVGDRPTREQHQNRERHQTLNAHPRTHRHRTPPIGDSDEKPSRNVRWLQPDAHSRSCSAARKGLACRRLSNGDHRIAKRDDISGPELAGAIALGRSAAARPFGRVRLLRRATGDFRPDNGIATGTFNAVGQTGRLVAQARHDCRVQHV